MATLKDIRRRIRSIQSTQQITKAMEMVAAAKLRRATERAQAIRPYAMKMTTILENAAGAASELAHPLFDVREVRRRTVVVLASDKGLAGSYNANIFREAEIFTRPFDRSSLDLIPVGRRANDYFAKRGYQGSLRIVELGDRANLGKAQALARHLVDLYTRKETDEVVLLYTHFISMGTRRIVEERLLPIRPAAAEGTSEGKEEGRAEGKEASEKRAARDYIFEPSPERIFRSLLARYVQTRVLTAMADALASEHAARLFSMSAATKNAGEVIQALTLVRNKLRQAAITKEISELVGGAEALK
ncbi:MAG: ATP synthase F1 subunit gamma [Candidatus Eisenbacteria bacterium]|nr:ATP synthase F1 subunit gamma [Candidatus Eisenbacteria bacterium]